ncbi:MAG: glucose-6-phosphate dehydrogenase [Rhabdochlamydiaceae bacterium]
MNEPILNPFLEKKHLSTLTDPCIIVIFGATGDLTARKLMPALYNLTKEGQLPIQFACVGFARRTKTHEEFRQEAKESVMKFSRSKPLDQSLWAQFEQHLFYHCAEFDNEDGYASLANLLQNLDQRFATKGNRIFYLSTQPSSFITISENLYKKGLVYKEDVKDKWSRLIIEKPFGRDHLSAIELQKQLLHFFSEKQIFRIDHYLGKESVQNLMVFRFANTFFEPLWNHKYIDHIQITMSEDIGIGTRGNLWEESGLLRDVVQNHIIQLISLVAMEQPKSLKADDIRDEKVKVLKALRPFSEKNLATDIVRAQYNEGFIDGKEVLKYREENNVAPDSFVETFVAFKLFIDNQRWKDVPFYIRSGKRLPKRATEIAVVFKASPSSLFDESDEKKEANVLAIRIQPDEGASLKMNCKVPGPSSPIQPVKMDFKYATYFGMSPPEAYERLICDCILGDSTLFAREDEVVESWKFLTPILDHWNKHKEETCCFYKAGTWGPEEANQIIEKDGRKWRLI